MVGYAIDQKQQLSAAEHAVAGATSGVLSRVIAQPLDVVKIRFQLQVEPVKKENGSKYWGVRHALTTIVKEEGVTALWKGHIPAQFLSVLYGTTQFVSFEFMTRVIGIHGPEKLSTTYRPLTHSVCGGLAACLGMVVSHPTDLLRTRLIAQGQIKMYQSIPTALFTILRKEGVLGFYKGLLPSLIMIGPQMGLQFGLYAAFKDLWQLCMKFSNAATSGTLENVVCGAASGVVSKAIIYPLDITKKRLEIRGIEEIRINFGATRKYSGLMHCLKMVIKDEGFRGLFKGLSPSLLKSAVVAATNFVVYEQTCALLYRRH